MGTLFLSFLIAIAGAIGIVSLITAMNLEAFTSRVFPFIPLLYALVYELLEKKKRRGRQPVPDVPERPAPAAFADITVGRMALLVFVSILIKIAVESFLTAVHLVASGQTFPAVYGTFSAATVLQFLRGDHPWVSGPQGTLLLALIAVITSLGTGLWIGSTTKANPILEGVLTGAVVTVVTSMTNLQTLYRVIEELTVQAADAFGYMTDIGFAVVIALQVLFYGLWSGIAYRARLEREAARKTGP